MSKALGYFFFLLGFFGGIATLIALQAGYLKDGWRIFVLVIFCVALICKGLFDIYLNFKVRSTHT